MPLFGKEYQVAMRGQPCCVRAAYMDALIYYWFHTKTSGLKNDAEFLRRICDVDNNEWMIVVKVLFNNNEFFTLDENGDWQQKRAQELWVEMSAKMQLRKKQTEAATNARRAKH